MNAPSDTELFNAWLAGLLEGEGSFISATEKNPVCLTVNMTDEDVIRRIASVWKVSVSKPKKQAEHHRQSYRCMIRGSRAIEWIKKVKPYLGARRLNQATKAIDSHVARGRPHKITKSQAAEIKNRHASGESAILLAKEFGITKWSVYAIKQGRRISG